jgi:hypothetical protein
MAEKDFDFEKYWLSKFSKCLGEIVGEDIQKEVMRGSKELSSRSNSEQVVKWSQEAMEKLDSLVDEEKRIEIMTGCACEYLKSDLREIRKAYEETENIDLVHQMLRKQFISFLKTSLELNDEFIKDILNRGWGLAGIKKGNMIIATKIPKSGFLLEYMKETDPEKKRALYCHCPRVRDILKTSDKRLSATYCYCGAGFYKAVWEEILQKPVKVEVLESVMKGDDVCKIGICLL